VPPTTALVGDAFGRRNIGAVDGWVTLVHQAGAALAAHLAGLAHGALGDYQAAFLLGGVVALAGGALALRVTPCYGGRRAARRRSRAGSGRPRGRRLPTGSPD
jgi:MFS family permease